MMRPVVSAFLLLAVSCSGSDGMGLTTFGEECIGKKDQIENNEKIKIKQKTMNIVDMGRIRENCTSLNECVR
jgi:hypothetical protein